MCVCVYIYIYICIRGISFTCAKYRWGPKAPPVDQGP